MFSCQGHKGSQAADLNAEGDDEVVVRYRGQPFHASHEDPVTRIQDDRTR